MAASVPSSIFDGLTSTARPEVRVRTSSGWDDGGAAFGSDVRALAAAMIGYGLAPAGRVAVLGQAGADALRAELAVLVAGGCLVSPDPALGERGLAHALAASEVVQAIACDERHLAFLLALRPELPSLELILLMRAQPSERRPAALLVSSAVAAGHAHLEREPEMLRAALASAKPSDPAVLYWRVAGASEALSRSGLATLTERIVSAVEPGRGRPVLVAVEAGSPVRLAAAVAIGDRDGSLLLADALERPDTGLDERPVRSALLSTHALSRLAQAWQDDIARRGWPSRAVARWSLRQQGDGWKRRLAELLTLRTLRSRLGNEIGHLDVVRQKPARLDPSTDSFFEVVGLPVRELAGDVPLLPGPAIAPSA
ncbi:MAG TPA: AMP-binding protein [Candidatus Polarisedimenticolaceae bacterium]|nr:AMP-binding protein [Candidatus Polarisedimenticolaceae bacterium]